MSLFGKTGWLEPQLILKTPEVRKQAVALLAPPLGQAAQDCWRPFLPPAVLLTVEQCAFIGVQAAVEGLTLSSKSAKFDSYWSFMLRSLPRYWEPPVAEQLPAWPETQLRATRWTAALIALHVRNALEDIHAEHTSDDTMPQLNTALRNCTYRLLLSRLDLAWGLSKFPRVAVSEALLGAAFSIPPVAG